MIKSEHWHHPDVVIPYEEPDRFQHERVKEILDATPEISTESIAELNPYIHPEMLISRVADAKDFFRVISFDGPNCPISLYTLDDDQSFKVALHLDDLDEPYGVASFPAPWTLIQVTDPLRTEDRHLLIMKEDLMVGLAESQVKGEISGHLPTGFDVFRDKLETLETFPLDLLMIFLSAGPTRLETRFLDLSFKGHTEDHDG